VGWRLPDGSVERPIGTGVFSPLASPLVRRVVNACVMTDDPTAAATLADLARSAAVPEGLRTEAMAALAEWMQPGPRDRVNGAYREVDASGRDLEAYRSVLRQKLPGLAGFGSEPVRAAARDLAIVHGIALDGTVSLAVVLDPAQPVADRVGCLRQLCVDGDSRAAEAIAAALASDEPALRAEARLRLALADPVRGAEALEEALTRPDRGERQRAVAALGAVPGLAIETVLTELVRRLEAGEIEPALALDVVRAAEKRSDGPLPSRVAAWRDAVAARGPDAVFALTLEGGDAANGRRIVEQHPSATCLKCHAIGGFGGNAAPALDGIGARVDRRSILRSLVDPGAEIAEGYGEASAMPSMATILTLDELRDVIEYLASLR
jgi:mono/diheme cytochrome c family protein